MLHLPPLGTKPKHNLAAQGRKKKTQALLIAAAGVIMLLVVLAVAGQINFLQIGVDLVVTLLRNLLALLVGIGIGAVGTFWFLKK